MRENDIFVDFSLYCCEVWNTWEHLSLCL